MAGHLKVLSWSLLAFTVAAMGCGSSKDSNPGVTGGDSGPTKVDLITWWTGPGEAEALQALIDVNTTRHPEDYIYNEPAASGQAARDSLALRIDAHDPPDLCQGNAHDLRAFLGAHPNALRALDSFLQSEGLTSVIFPDVLQNVSVDGAVYTMPNNIHRENSLFYNKQIFQDHNLQPPTTLAEFLAVCQALKTAGITPVATAYQGWIIRIMFNSLAMGSMGSDKFSTFMKGGARDDASMQAAIDLLDDVLTNYVNANASSDNFNWTDAAEEVHAGRAAMYFHGDWAKGYFVQKDWTPGIDFGVIAAPGASDMFWYGVDTISLPAEAKNPNGALHFLDTVGTVDGQVAFNRLKGSTPIRSDIPPEKLDSEGRATLADFQNAKYHMLVVGSDAWDNALLAFAQSRDKTALLQAYIDNPPPIQ